MKNCDFGLENAALGLRPRAAFSRPRSQFFTIRTSQPANNIYIFYLRILRYSEVIYFVRHCQSYHETESRSHREIRNENLKKLVVGVHGLQAIQNLVISRCCFSEDGKCTNNYNVRAQLLFCSLKLLFGDVPVAVAVVVCFKFPDVLGLVHTLT